MTLPEERSIESFIENDQANLSLTSRDLPPFADLAPRLNALYHRSIDQVPKTQPAFGQFLLLCHKSFLTAAVTIGGCHPDDAAPITRRAIEAASVALAIKRDPVNLERWRNTRKRTATWEARLRGEKEPRFGDEVVYPDDARLARLASFGRMLSDAFVRFTPEFFADQSWRTETM